MNTSAEVALELTRALDEADWPSVEGVLHPFCRYAIRGQEIVGRKAIVDSYRAADEWAKSTFDVVEYESSVVKTDPSEAEKEAVDRFMNRHGISKTFLQTNV